MFTHKHYVPVLKAKEGEYKALQETTAPTKDIMTPILEIPSIPWNYAEECDLKTIDAHLSNVGEKIHDSWGRERRIFIESDSIEGQTRMLDGVTHHLVYLFNNFRGLNLTAIPVTGFNRHADYKDAVRTIINVDKRGICLRLGSSDIIDVNLAARITETLAFYGLTPQEVDLIVDLKSIVEDSLELALYTMTSVINFTLPHINDWRTLTVSGSSFPINLVDISANTIDSIDRVEWLFWNRLINTLGLKRKPSFGDYSIAHWETADLDPRKITMSASIRYTSDTYWLIVRGRSIKVAGGNQYHNLCNNLIARPEYSGPAFSWGDNYINECAGGRVGPGNPTTWRKVGNNHHFQKVASQISILP